MAQDKSKGLPKGYKAPAGSVQPKDPTAIRYIKDVANRKRGHVTVVHSAIAKKLVEADKAELYTDDMEALPPLEKANVMPDGEPQGDVNKSAKAKDAK